MPNRVEGLYSKEFVAALDAACRAHPEQRTCQVLVNALGGDPFYLEDSEAIVRLFEYACLVPDAQ